MHRKTFNSQVLTVPEYIQLKAFARIDGALLFLLWAASFVCYIVGLTNPLASMIAMLLAVLTPFFVAKRLKKFRDIIREGVISVMRGWLYIIFMFLYSSLLFSLLVFAYFEFLDHGYVMQVIQQMMDTPEMIQVLKQYHMEESMSQMMIEMASVRSIDIALNLLFTNIIIGLVLGLPISAILSSNTSKLKK